MFSCGVSYAHGTLKKESVMSQNVLDAVHKLFQDYAETQTDTVFFTFYAVRGMLTIPVASEFGQVFVKLP